MAWAAKAAMARSVMALVALPLDFDELSGKVDSQWRGGFCTAPRVLDKMIDKTYQPAEVEGRIYKTWEQAGAFLAGRPERASAAPYAIVIPPPNVTGSLHMGHALNNTLQDILCRFERMRGKDVLWQPGTDHAGIATQMVVERQLMERQLPGRREMGREAFLKRVWEWKAESGGTIVNQLKRLGASCDWSRERFTMDEGLSRAVLKVFVELYRDGLIYKDKRLVNWDPKLLTAISDLEVVQVETKGNMWHFRYPLVDDPEKYICIATTRPETMLGDGAVAVHPDDERYKHLVGKLVRLPLAERLIPIIADEYPDPEKGSGAVKITAAHDFNDFEVWTRHRDKDYFKKQLNGGLINLFTPEAKMNENCPPPYQGLDRYEARKRIVVDLESLGLVDKIEKITHAVPHGDRSNVVVEPYLTDQWYVNAKKMAEPAIAAVREGKTKFVPKNWEKTYFEWMENIQPWCISRQLWWGHQIPAWYGPDGKVFVVLTEAEALSEASKHYGKATPLKRDEDVLDTWFSSALWPFSTLGWPDATPEVKRYYPTNTLVTGFDIIFFWVARMMMMGLHFKKEAPFHDVYIHRLVRDATGAKMSKSKGNVVDPLGVIDDFGADALRFTLARGAAQGHDIRLGPQDVENNRNFATKLWNAARFVEFNGAARVEGFDPKSAKETLNRWIAHETAKAADEITKAIEAYAFNEAAAAAYRFVWNVYCDWYVELSKPLLTGPDGAAKDETRAMAAWALDEILRLLHPFMPFITEELWRLRGHETSIALEAYPRWEASLDDPETEQEMSRLRKIAGWIRSVRAENKIDRKQILTGSIDLMLWEKAVLPSLTAIERQENVTVTVTSVDRRVPLAYPPNSVLISNSFMELDAHGKLATSCHIELAVPMSGEAANQQKDRASKENQQLEKVIANSKRQLENQDFVSKAPAKVIEGMRSKLAEYEAQFAKNQAALSE